MKKVVNRNNYLKAGLVSAALSALLLVLVYVYWNRSYTYGYGDKMIVNWAKRKDLYIGHKFDGSKIAPVNVAYDKILVPHIDRRDSTVAGVRAITDRGELLTFLKMLKERDRYGYIMCDVRFDDHHTEYDEELFATIASMRDIVVACDNKEDAPEAIRDVVAESKYTSRQVGDMFMKYDLLLPDGSSSMALRMWEDITGNHLEKKWWGYTIGGKLCVRSLVYDFRYSIYDDLSHTDAEAPEGVNMYSSSLQNLGSQVVEPYLEGYKSGKYFDGKFIIVGDFTEYDIHTTITGNQPGPVVVFNALLSLMEGDNILPFWVYLLVYVVFWLESMFLLRNKFELNLRSFRIFRQIRARFYRKRRPGQRMGIHNTLYLLLGFFTYSTPLWIMGVALYAVLGIFVNVIIVGTVFWVISWFV